MADDSDLGSYTILYGTDGRDTLYNYDYQLIYYAGGRADKMYNWVDYSQLFGQKGNDYLYSYANYCIVNGGGGIDRITSTGIGSQLVGGGGKDYIHNYGDQADIDGGSGSDFIYNNQLNDGEDIASSVRGNDSVIYGGAGNDTIVNFNNERVIIDGGNDKDAITNTLGIDARITAGAGDDTVTNIDSDGTSIDGGSGNDVIQSQGSDNVVIYGQDGEDFISIISSDGVTVYGGDQNDTITVVGGNDNVLIGGSGYDQLIGGAGNEHMHYYYADNKGNGDHYDGGDGFDTLYLHFDYTDLSFLALQNGSPSIVDYIKSIEATFNAGDAVSFADLGFDLNANNFEALNIDITNQPDNGFLYVSDAEIVEGSNGESQWMQFTVQLSGASDQEVSVDYTTAGLTASGILNSDFLLSHGSILFNPGETIQTVSIEVYGDNAFEGDETISFNLVNSSGADIAKAEAIGTIVDDDVLPEPTGLDVPILNSNLQATKVLYLDFDGAVVTNTGWNKSSGVDTIDAKAYDVDGNTDSFNSTEIQNINEIFYRVSEDFNPFNVNVTTDYSVYEATSTVDRLNAVITDSNDWYSGNVGGVAYVGVAGRLNENYQPAWVFSEGLQGSPKYVADTISHELGHNLGLKHDGKFSTEYYKGHGSGDTGWAPIMGVGFYKELTQWSKGEYNGASNLQDDVAKLAEYFDFRDDDHSNSFDGATELHLGQGLAAEGIIEQQSDEDVFMYSLSDHVSFYINGMEQGTNLDILANLYDESGVLLATSNPLDSLNATLEYQTDHAMTVYLTVEGTGLGDDPLSGGYSDYGSLGYYNITIA